MSKHTPGPWVYGQDGFNLGNGVVYARHPGGNPKDIATIRCWGDEQRANAKLIAAAPGLLAALEALVGACNLNSSAYLRSCKRDAELAIARAIGGDL